MRPPDAFKQHVIKAKRQIERRITIPGAFCVEKDWAGRTDKDILRTDISVHQGDLGICGAHCEIFQASSAFGMPPGGGAQVGV